MQDFGTELRRRLEQERRFVCGWVWWCADGTKSFGPMNSERELELLMASTDSMCVCL